MSKKLIFGIALSLVLVSSGFFSAQANCGGGGCLSSLAPCNWRLSSLCGWPSWLSFHCGSKDSDRAQVKDMDKSYATRQGAYPRSSTTP